MIKNIEKLRKEYLKKKRDYIKANLNNDNVYNYFTIPQKQIIKKYYEQYSMLLFNRMKGSLRLEVSKSKAKKLAELKGEGDWDFAGMVDMGVKGAETCELGHLLRYCYYARNTQNGNLLIFGSTCVGDFFDLSQDDVKLLTNLKDIMLKEIKDMVAIKENYWFDEYTLFEADVIGRVWKYMGGDSLARIKGIPLKSLISTFVELELPLPQTLLSEVLREKESIEKNIDEYIMFRDNSNTKYVYNSGIPFLAEMFKIGFKDIVDNTKKPDISDAPLHIKEVYKYFGFNTKEDLKGSLKIWCERADRINKAQAYFKKIGIETPWNEIFKEMIKDKAVDKEVYLGVNLLTVFDLQGEVSRVYGNGNMFPYKCNGVDLPKEILDNFDKIVDNLAKKGTIEYILKLDANITARIAEEKAEKDKEKQMIEYIIENIDKVKYQGLWGRDGIKDILINKGLTIDKMTEKQGKFVERFYTEMQGIDLRDSRDELQASENRTYTLNEKPEVIAKIQRLQNEAEDKTPQKTKDIMATILKYQKVSDRQLKHINSAYLEYVIGEKSSETREEVKPEVQSENRKYKLKDRPDIKAKLIEIQGSPKYDTLPLKTRDIITSVLKYNTISDKQLVYVESAYEKVRV